MKALSALAIFAGTIVIYYPVHKTERLRRYHKLMAQRKMKAYARNAQTFQQQAALTGEPNLRLRA